MNIFILICNIFVPVLMLCIGILYKRHLNKKIDKILDLFIPIAMIGSGVGSDDNMYSKDTDIIVSANKKCSLIWSISAIFTLILTVIVLMLNKSDIINATNFLDTTNVSVIMLEVELAIAVIVFTLVEYVLKNAFYKKGQVNS